MNTTTAPTSPVAIRQIARPQHNWPLYLLVVLIPLQNIYLEELPNFGAGLNAINMLFIAALYMAMRCGNGLVRGSGVNGWVWAFMGVAFIALLNGLNAVEDAGRHPNMLKDQLIAMSIVFLAQMSVSNWAELRRLYVLTLLPLPYMFFVLREQNMAIDATTYTHDLRINATFVELGANEMAAFFVTASLVALGLTFCARVKWQWRAFFAVAAAVAATGVILSYSRTAYVAILIGAAIIILVPRTRFRLIVPVFLIALILPVLLPPAVVERFETITIEEGERDQSTEDRFEFWSTAVHEWSKRPVMGIGYHTFHHPEFNPAEMDVHNFFLRELVEKGIVGAVVLIGLLWSLGRLIIRGYREAPPDSWYAGLTLGLLGAFVALLIGNIFGDRFTYYPMIAHFWLYIGLALRGLQLRHAELVPSLR
ncbi:MAG: O-antigen ligase family protein [Wenzhouxiangella sp.]